MGNSYEVGVPTARLLAAPAATEKTLDLLFLRGKITDLKAFRIVGRLCRRAVETRAIMDTSRRFFRWHIFETGLDLDVHNIIVVARLMSIG